MRPARYSFLDHDGPIPFAHRGGAKEGPENTWAAFSHARSLGYRYLETDVHLSADGVVVVIHDPVLDRVADRSGSVAELPWAEISKARVSGTEAIPRLDELLAAWPDARWNIDAKHGAVVGPLLDVLTRASALGRVCVTSFSDGSLRRIRREAGPGLCTSMGPAAVAGLRLASLLPPAGAPQARAAAAQVPVSWRGVPVVEERFVALAHRRGLAVHVWTVDDGAEMDRLLDLGVDGIMTDRPTLLREVLQRRNAWSDI